MKKLIIFEAILIIFFVLSWNVSKAEGGNVYSIGQMDCGEIISKYESDLSKIYIEAYILGYITGSLVHDKEKSSSFSGSAVIQETINYCKKNPLEDFWLAIYVTFIKITT